jgi:uncharacterized protein
MRRLLIALLWLAPLGGWADTGGHPVSMWMVEGAHNHIYLLGSIHLLRAQDHPLPAVIDAAYDDADTLLMELDMDDLDPVAMQTLVTSLGVIQDGRTLRDLMGQSLYEEAVRSAAAVDIPLDMLAKSEPWLAAITIEQLALTRIGFNPNFGIEMHLAGKAAADGKEILGLETMQEQLGYLDGLPLDAQRELVMQTLEESADISSMMDRVIEAWRTGDTNYLQDFLLSDMRRYPDLYKALVTDRNQRWARHISELLDQQQDYLIVVGALHLIGDDGVPALLRKAGIVVTQMRQP